MKLRSFKNRIRPYLPPFVVASYYSLQICPLIFWPRLLYEFKLLIIRLKEKYYNSRPQDSIAMVEFNIETIINKNWVNFKEDPRPLDRRMSVLKLGGVHGLSTENIAFLINEIVRLSARNGVYLEVGTFKGYSILSAALYNPSTRCVGIDNFSQFDPMHINEKALRANLRKFGCPKNIEFYNLDYREGIKYLSSGKHTLKVNVYYYDGEHSYSNQAEGLRIILPYLSEKCIILVDDINCESVEKANMDFLTEYREFRSVFKVKTEENGSRGWWDGFEVITRGF